MYTRIASWLSHDDDQFIVKLQDANQRRDYLLQLAHSRTQRIAGLIFYGLFLGLTIIWLLTLAYYANSFEISWRMLLVWLALSLGIGRNVIIYLTADAKIKLIRLYEMVAVPTPNPPS